MRPFTFACEKRAALRSSETAASSSNSYHVPMAEFNTNYQTSNPPRFRHIPNTPGLDRTVSQKTGDQFGLGSHLTIAKTPKLLTKGRKRPVATKGEKEMEEEDILKMKQCVFAVVHNNFLSPPPLFYYFSFPTSFPTSSIPDDFFSISNLTTSPSPQLLFTFCYFLCAPFLLYVSLLIIVSLSYAHRHQFKAKPFNRHFNNGGLYSVPLKRTFELTRPMTPDFASKKVIKKRRELMTSRKQATRICTGNSVPSLCQTSRQ